MDAETICPDLFDEDITQEADGTFTVSLEPWTLKKIQGIPTHAIARRIAHVAHEAMDGYGQSCMSEF